MSATQHTPGPWLTRTAPTSAGLCHIVSAADWKGAFIYGDGIRPGIDDALPKAIELAANARLIAAAPDLLEALRKRAVVDAAYSRLALMDADDDERERLLQQIEDAEESACDSSRAAIAKAEGQS